MRTVIIQFLSGGIMMGCLAVGYFFFNYWKKTRDSLFAVFAASFWVLAVERTLMLATSSAFDASGGENEFRPYVYWVRFAGFMLIIVGFWLKNRRSE